MGLLEFLLEKRNPGKIGDIKKNNQPIKYVSLTSLIIKLIVCISIVFGLFYITVLNNLNFINTVTFILILFIYCFISYKFIPQPDATNVGLLGGLIDHPFRISDDFNRMLIVLLVLLYPGRFISTTIIQIIVFIKEELRK